MRIADCGNDAHAPQVFLAMPLFRRMLRGTPGYIATVSAGVLSTVIASFFVPSYQWLIIAVSPTSFARSLRAQLNEQPAESIRLRVNEVTRILGENVSIQALEVYAPNTDPDQATARILIEAPNRAPIEAYLQTRQEHEFVYRNATYSVKVVQLMPEDQTVDVEILGPRDESS